MSRHGAIRLLALLGLLAACACSGYDPEPAASDPAMEPATNPAPAAPAGNEPPEIRSVLFEPDPPLPGQRVGVRVAASDPEGVDLRYVYAWRLAGERIGRGQAGFVLPERSKGAPLEVSVIAHDGESESEPFVARTEVGNRPPKLLDLVMEPGNQVFVSDEIAASPRAEDPDGDPLSFEYIWLVNGRRVSEAGATLRSPHFKRGDRVEFQVRATDGETAGDPLAAPVIEIQNSPPVITSTPSGLDATGTFRYSPVVEDPDGDRRLRFRLTEAPEGMRIDWLAGRVSWRPGDEQTGKHAVTIEVDDSSGGIVTQSFSIDVALEDADQPTPAAPAR
ncbi:MAG: hypothetical protein QNK04_08820 [Myxococcota bacterium]|nr:hypothetical protein [Myxococcota bacterium]